MLTKKTSSMTATAAAMLGEPCSPCQPSMCRPCLSEAINCRRALKYKIASRIMALIGLDNLSTGLDEMFSVARLEGRSIDLGKSFSAASGFNPIAVGIGAFSSEVGSRFT